MLPWCHTWGILHPTMVHSQNTGSPETLYKITFGLSSAWSVWNVTELQIWIWSLFPEVIYFTYAGTKVQKKEQSRLWDTLVLAGWMRRAGPVLRNGATLGCEFYVYNNVCRCTYTSVHVEARVNLWFCCSGGCPPCFLKQCLALTRTGGSQLRLTGLARQQAPGVLMYLPLQQWEHKNASPCLAFKVDVGNWTQVLILSWHGLYWLGHLPSPGNLIIFHSCNKWKSSFV